MIVKNKTSTKPKNVYQSKYNLKKTIKICFKR